jgi:hypothetical protein
MMEERRSWIDDVTERQFLIFLSSHSKIQNQQSAIINHFPNRPSLSTRQFIPA